MHCEFSHFALSYKEKPEKFHVSETISFQPTGQGAHLYVRVRKRNLSSRQAMLRLADHIGADRKSAGYAGQKDRFAVTEQWFSYYEPARIPDVGERIECGEDGFAEVLEVTKHPKRLKVGRVRENTFDLLVSGIERDRDEEFLRLVAQIRSRGLPNYYGEQRFRGDTLDRARAWLVDGGKSPRKPHQRRFLVSALQSRIFNAYVAARIDEGLFDKLLLGDLAKIHETGGVFWIDSEADLVRAQDGEVSATGPMPGSSMRRPREKTPSFDLENDVLNSECSGVDWNRAGKLARGTRRSIRVFAPDFKAKRDGNEWRLQFTLPSGSYATTLLAEIHKGHGTDLGAKTLRMR